MVGRLEITDLIWDKELAPELPEHPNGTPIGKDPPMTANPTRETLAVQAYELIAEAAQAATRQFVDGGGTLWPDLQNYLYITVTDASAVGRAAKDYPDQSQLMQYYAVGGRANPDATGKEVTEQANQEHEHLLTALENGQTYVWVYFE